ncbi:MAG: hypothetical protein IAG13_37325, partial [Deltaproteobacteria bacterium]|nr:hypothetical protein [Nannocystaceae bacterium]
STRSRLLATTLVAACTGEPAPAASTDAQPGAIEDPRDQYALLHDIEAALGDGLGRDAGAMTSVQQAWQGRRYRWELAMVPMFCTAPERCFLAPFDHARSAGGRIRQGWMPRLELDATGFAALQQACAGKAACVVRIAGTLQRFVFEVEQPTALELGEIEIVGAREADATESWLASKARS